MSRQPDDYSEAEHAIFERDKAKARAERLEKLLREIRQLMHVNCRSDAMLVYFTQAHIDRIDAALGEKP